MKQVQLAWGDDAYRMDEWWEKWRAEPMETVIIPGDAPILEWTLIAGSMTLFGEPKQIMGRNPVFLTQKLPPDSTVASILEIVTLASANGHRCIWRIDGKWDMRLKQNSELKSHVDSQEFRKFKEWDQDARLAWIRDRVGANGKSIGMDAQLALEACGSELGIIAREIDKLVMYCGDQSEITPVDVRAVCTRDGFAIYDWIEAIKKRDNHTIISGMDSLIRSGEDPVKLIGTMAAQVKLYYELLVGIRSGMSISNIAVATKKNSYYLERILHSIRNHYTVKQCFWVLRLLARADVLIKTGQMRPEKSVELVVFHLCRL